MRLANVEGRAALVVGDTTLDVHRASDGRFGSAIPDIFDDWADFRRWYQRSDRLEGDQPLDVTRLGPVSPAPRQIFAVGLNYRSHALEAGIATPERPMVFTKFVSSLAPPHADIAIPTPMMDWEVELAVVVGIRAYKVRAADAWQHVVGVTAAQDFSARDVQMNHPSTPQFSLGKSFPGFTPLGPSLVTADEFTDPDDIGLTCTLNGHVAQHARTNDLVFSVPELIEYLSDIVTLLPGDVVLTGTPSGVGVGRRPPVFLRPGDKVGTHVEGVGWMLHRMVAGVCHAG